MEPPLTSESEEVSETEEEASAGELSWIAWFCSIRGNEFFTEVDEEYIQDEFNLTGLSAEVPYFDYALDTILDVDSPNADQLTEEQQETVDAAAELLYGLIHARFLLTTKGLNAMYDKFMEAEFGRCPRVLCSSQALLPVGQSDLPRKATVSLYCPRCNDLYAPRSSRHANVDGAYFGTTFPHLYLMTFPQCVPEPPPEPYVPRVFGFRIRRAPIVDEPGGGDTAASGAGGGAGGAAGDNHRAGAPSAGGAVGAVSSAAPRGGGTSPPAAVGEDVAAALKAITLGGGNGSSGGKGSDVGGGAGLGRKDAQGGAPLASASGGAPLPSAAVRELSEDVT